MNTFILKIDDGFYTITDGGEVSTTTDPKKAKVIEGFINLNSHWERLYNAVLYNDLFFSEITIQRLGNNGVF